MAQPKKRWKFILAVAKVYDVPTNFLIYKLKFKRPKSLSANRTVSKQKRSGTRRTKHLARWGKACVNA